MTTAVFTPSPEQAKVIAHRGRHLQVIACAGAGKTEAAGYLGVSPNMLRNWQNAGKVVAIRHPVNGYRLFKKEDLDALLKQVAQTSGKSSKD
jgi:DNA (cytosine-5)-methyltransferase 1